MGFNYEQYELSASRDNVDYNSWSNATGYTKEELISKIRTAKDSIEKSINDRNTAQLNYDEANNRSCPSPCKGKCHPNCDTKTTDKNYNLGIINSTTLTINTANANIPTWQNELDDLIEKEANTPSSNTGGGTSKPNTGTGTSGGTDTGANPKKSNTVLYASIGGAVLILGLVGFFVFRNK
jgi:hypothetical protein